MVHFTLPSSWYRICVVKSPCLQELLSVEFTLIWVAAYFFTGDFLAGEDEDESVSVVWTGDMQGDQKDIRRR